MPEEAFSPWMHWNQRSLYDGRHQPGVYLLGRFEDVAPDEVDPCDERILLVAETHAQSLSGRWDQFKRSAFNGADGHIGGVKFHLLYGNGPDTTVPSWLYVAAHPVPEHIKDTEAYTTTL